ncbi:membrane-bound PQQ-dependent dehydrogenase, glucose/quinate/shikimate family [uncultured Bartonella sp.]|uniref:membrane-bound PQQ-dependent dehydrogenase, glucose/quinate/shikimate family n=1 Tax=uncultured Bartonella sp. TaxID=104108 RepID=UPI0025EF7690|nr:membrane-bound PQQ-dependent dehydrogenase, glucose/quinate/shikimate family [uncultured Bartonella sp.]
MIRFKNGPSRITTVFIILLSLSVLSAGLHFTLLGGYLLYLGSKTWYYLALGLFLLISGFLMILLKPLSVWIFALLYIMTVIWSYLEVGLNYWQEFANLFALSVAFFLVLLAYWPMAKKQGKITGKTSLVLAGLLFMGMAAAIVSSFTPKNVIRASEKAKPAIPVSPANEQKDWKNWGNDEYGSRFAALDQITPSNIKKLDVAWIAHTGDIPESTGAGAEDQNTPLQIGTNLYVCTAYGKVLSFDIDTGKEKWRFDPKGAGPNWQRCRGLGYFEVEKTKDANTDEACQARLFLPTGDARLIAIDAKTGKLCEDFGDKGTVDLKIGMGEVKPGYYQQTSTPLVADNVVIVGGRIADNFSTNEPPGVVRAYSVYDGHLVWAWDPGNPDLHGLPPEGQTYTRGTPNVWAAMSYDAKLGLVYLPTGNSTPDFWAGYRTAEDDKYSSSVVAVDVKTGNVRWHYQFVHHDIWDFDTPAQPVLLDAPDNDGNIVPALIQVTKQGEVFLLNRETGEPIADVQEKPVPQGNVAGERYSPTQRFSVGMPSFGNATLKESDMWGTTPFDKLLCRIEFVKMRHQGVFTPPGLDYSLQMLGSLGGMNWGSVSTDPTLNYVFVNDMRLGLANYLVERKDIPKSASGIEMGIVPMTGTPFGAMRKRFLSPLGVPCQKPPFGTLSAIDLKTRKIVWQVPVGTVKDTGPFNIALGVPVPIGMPTLGASLATQSGLVFFAGTQDFYLRAFDSRTGKEVWKSRLPIGSQGGPMTYVSPKTGKQYVVITAGGARQNPKRGDYVIAYTLKE